jgi:hypothetical protein
MSTAVNPVSAGGFSGEYSVFDGSWSEWQLLNGTPDGSAVLTFGSTCATTTENGPTGVDEFQFAFDVDLSTCFVPSAQLDGLTAAVFTWRYLDDAGQPVEFECLSVAGRATTSGFFDGAIEFGVNLGSQGTNQTRGELTNVDEVTFALVHSPFTITSFGDRDSDLGAQNGDGAGIFEIEISISPCSWDGPDIDIEHYQRLAAEMTALPDTL